MGLRLVSEGLSRRPAALSRTDKEAYRSRRLLLWSPGEHSVLKCYTELSFNVLLTRRLPVKDSPIPRYELCLKSITVGMMSQHGNAVIIWG